MKLRKKLISLLLILTMCLTMNGMYVMAADTVTAAEKVSQNDIVVLYDNDVHCAVDGYSAMAGLKNEMLQQTNNVALVSSGDFLQGATIGAISKGKSIVSIMNQVGYDVVTLGNHEFDYKVPLMRRSLNKLTADVVSCNFIDLRDNTNVFPGYTIKTYGNKKVAFVGITTPESITKSTPTYFMNSKGKYIFGFCGDETGKALYKQVQKTVNAAKKAGADYVIALSHLGTESVTERWSAQTVIANTYGIDAILDGHSHSTIDRLTLKNKKDESVLLSSTGTKFENIGQLVIKENGKMKTNLVSLKDTKLSDEKVTECIANIKKDYEAQMSKVIGRTDVDLTTLNPTTGKRAVRNAETNMGDFCTDALRNVLGADVAIMNGGGIRADIKKGNVTYNDLLSVYPWSNMGCVVEATGQQIKDALEFGASSYPAESGGFLQVSGIKYTINSAAPSTVEKNKDGMFVKVTGDYRVSDIQVQNKTTGAYEPIDLTKTYTVAGINYTLKSCGDGYTMFKNNNYIKDEVVVDNEVLIEYLTGNLNGVIGTDYENPTGQGRILIK